MPQQVRDRLHIDGQEDASSNAPFADAATETEIEREAGEFMFAAMMGAVDGDVLGDWKTFYAESMPKVTEAEQILLETVARALKSSAVD